VHAHHLGDLLPDREHGVERGHRLLEDHADAVAADPPDVRLAHRDEVLPLEVDAAPLLDAAGRADEAEHRHRGDRLAAPRLAHEADRLAGVDVERDAVHRARRAGGGVEVRPEVADGQ
jgi:hypothetical protein